MSKLGRNLWQYCLIMMMVGLLAACGSDDADGPVVIIEDDPVENECVADTECGNMQSCVDGKCVDTGCSSDSQCPGTQICDDGECVRPPARQCSSVGQTCDPNLGTADGFTCYDNGDGAKCYRACEVDQFCAADGTYRDSYNCPSGSVCAAGNACIPGNCSGFLSGQETCSAIAEDNPENFPNGANCISERDANGNSSNVCAPAGLGGVGAPCPSGPRACQPGLVCVSNLPLYGNLGQSSFCAKACNDDSACTEDGQACIGDDTGITQGVGFCGDRCEPYEVSGDDCGDGGSCLSVSHEDGMCMGSAGTQKRAYDSCNAQAQVDECPSGTLCMQLSQSAASCLPICNPSLPTQAERDATCPAPSDLAFVSFAHLARGLENVKVFVDGELFVDGMQFHTTSGQNGSYLALDAGTYNFVVRADIGTSLDEVVLDWTETLGINDARSWTLLNQDEGVVALQTDQPRDIEVASGQVAKWSVVLGSNTFGNVDVVAVPTGEDVAVEIVQNVLATDLAYGETAEFAEMALLDSTTSFHVYVFAAGTEWEDGNEIVRFDDIVVTQREVLTVVLLDSTGDSGDGDNAGDGDDAGDSDGTGDTAGDGDNASGDIGDSDGTGDSGDSDGTGDAGDAGDADRNGDAGDSDGNGDEGPADDGDVDGFGDAGDVDGSSDGEGSVDDIDPDVDGSSDGEGTVDGPADGEVNEFTYVAGALEMFSLPYTSASESAKLGGYCYNLSQDGSARPGEGICLQSCNNSDQYGTGACSGDGYACNPVGMNMGWCFPAGVKEKGESCEVSDDCADGLFCEVDGSGAGVCKSYCQPNSETNSALGCDTGESCVPMEGYSNLGQCRILCTPDENYSDDSCPENMKGCYGESDVTYCRPSGDVPVGEDCGDASLQNCEAGSVCAHNVDGSFQDWLTGAFDASEAGEISTCRPLCKPFAGNHEDGGCPDNMACMPTLPNGEFSTTIGHCVDRVEEPIMTLQPCSADQIGTMCDENSFCLDDTEDTCGEPVGMCVQICDYATRSGCTGGATCSSYSDDGQLLDLFGICRSI